MSSPVEPVATGPDRITRLLEAGLIGVVVLAPLPFGAVTVVGRTGLEIAAGVLGILWVAGAAVRGSALPALAVRIGLAGLLILGIATA